MSIVPESGQNGEWTGKPIFFNKLWEDYPARVGTGGSPVQVEQSSTTPPNLCELASASEREQKRRSGRYASHGQAGALHGLLNLDFVRPHPGIFGIVLRRGIEHRET